MQRNREFQINFFFGKNGIFQRHSHLQKIHIKIKKSSKSLLQKLQKLQKILFYKNLTKSFGIRRKTCV
jgi:hypothetical protein